MGPSRLGLVAIQILWRRGDKESLVVNIKCGSSVCGGRGQGAGGSCECIWVNVGVICDRGGGGEL